MADNAPGPAEDQDKLAARLFDEYRQARDAEKTTRKAAKVVRAFLDGEQWDPETKAKLAKDKRPAIVINKMFKVRNNLVGRQRDNRLAFKAYPVGASDIFDAQAITKVLKYIEDQTRYPYVESEAFQEMVDGPMGWLEIGYDDTNPAVEPIYARSVDPFEIYLDPHGKASDLRDHRWLIRSKWVDLDLVLARYPKHEATLRAAVEREKQDPKVAKSTEDDYALSSLKSSLDWGSLGEPEWCDAARSRVKIREHWYWKNEAAAYYKWPDGRTAFSDDLDPMEAAAALFDGATVHQGVRRVYYFAVCVGETVLEHSKSPYRHDHGFPYVPVWAYRNRYGRPFGPGLMQLDAQRDLNVNYSRATEAIRSRYALLRSGALGKKITLDQFTDLLGRPNFAAEVDMPEAINIQSDAQLTGTWLQLGEKVEKEIDDIVGHNEAAYGDKSNERSGTAIRARQQAQSLNYGELFDNLAFARRIAGEIFVSLVQQFYSPEKIRRIIEAQAQMDGDASIDWLDKVMAGPITQLRFNIKIEDQVQSTTERQASLQQRIELIGMLPDPLKPVMLPSTIRMTDDPEKDELAARLEQMLMPAPPVPDGPQPMAPGGVPPGMPSPGAAGMMAAPPPGMMPA